MVFFALLIESAREECLAPLLDALHVPEDGRQPIARAVIDHPQLRRLPVIVIRVEKVAMGAVLLALHVAHHLQKRSR